jgi:galactokinase/mevalonate kinase-like predicted kinase
MKKLLSLPPNLVSCFHEVEQADQNEWFCTSDPVGSKLGSGGGTTFLLQACHEQWKPKSEFSDWLKSEKRILLHAGGQSRRLPSYAPSGKILTPIPVFRWELGQRLGQNLLSLQLPLYEEIMSKAPSSLHTLVASGDVYVRAGKLQPIPDVDVVCYGLWVNPNLASHHGVFVSSRRTPGKLKCMLQKPTVEELGKLLQSHLFLMDVGIWLLSDRAVQMLIKRSQNADGTIKNYDLYSEFGCALGTDPTLSDSELSKLSVAILPLPDGKFYHYGTTREMISSTVAIQNLVNDQRSIMHLKVKPHPAIFVQNSDIGIKFCAENSNVWVENSHIGRGWKISHEHVITGVPKNDWNMNLPAGTCVDVIPIGQSDFVLRPYGFDDTFRGELTNPTTLYLGCPVTEWMKERNILPDMLGNISDLQAASLFPRLNSIEEMGIVLRWMTSEPSLTVGRNIWLSSTRLSANEISDCANLHRLTEQRRQLQANSWKAIAKNHTQSVFYQLNLKDAAEQFHRDSIDMPAPISEQEGLMTRIHDAMFRSQLLQLNNRPFKHEEEHAFELLREGLTSLALDNRQSPHLDVYPDQIVWSRSPVRIDLAGGWTDTPPHCLVRGGNVVNMAIEMNGQKPLQAYVKPCKDHKIILRSIDLGAMEKISSFDELRAFNSVGSPFSIPKAALALAGFLPEFCSDTYTSLDEQLNAFGSGLELTLLSAIPAGSGLGTSSILASTVLAAIANFCGLGWDKNEICMRTLILEQLLTTGGGWQDQYGGVLQGVKLLQTNAGLDQSPVVRWLPDYLFNEPEHRQCHLLYFTGITRVAKGILAEIVRSMFLNSTEQLHLLAQMKEHALDLYEAIQRNNFEEMGLLVGKSWQQNKQLDSGTNPADVEALINQVKDYCLGYKLPGAGGGGFLYMVAKDPEAAMRIRVALRNNTLHPSARFSEISLSGSGLQVSRS